MSLATLGVPHAAASVIVIPQPSAADALATIQRHEVLVGHPAGQMHPLGGVELLDEILEVLALGTLAHDEKLDVGHSPADAGHGGDQRVESLHGHEASGGDHERSG